MKIFSPKLPPPLLHLQESFSGNPLAKPPREARRSAKQAGGLQTFTIPPSSISNPRIYSRQPSIASPYSLPPFPGETPCFLPSCGLLKNSPSSLSPFLSINFQYLETHFIKNPQYHTCQDSKEFPNKWHTTIKLSLVAETPTETKEQISTQQR